jgi:hypothetical protein
MSRGSVRREDLLGGFGPRVVRGRGLAPGPRIRNLQIIVGVGSGDVQGIEQRLVSWIAAGIGRDLLVIDRGARCHSARGLYVHPCLAAIWTDGRGSAAVYRDNV